MRLFILTLIGIGIGVAIAWIGFPKNLAIFLVLFLFVITPLSPVAAMVGLLGVTPMRILWHRGGIAPEELVYSLVFLWLLGLTFLKEFLRQPSGTRPKWHSPIALPLFCLGGVGVYGTVLALLRHHSFAHWTSDLNFILFYGSFFIVTVNGVDRRQIYRIFWPTLWLTAGTVAWEMVRRLMEGSLFVGINPGIPRAANFSSTFFILCISLLLFLEGGGLKKGGLFLITCFFGLHQFLCLIRTIWIAQIGALGFLLLALPFSPKRRFLKWAGTLFIAASLLFSFSWVAPTEHQLIKLPTRVMNRFLSIFTDVRGTGVTMRTRYSEWEGAWRTYLQHPLTGNGLGTQIQYIRYDYERLPLTTERYIHSSYVYYLLNTGPLGLAVFLWLCACAVRYGLQVYRRALDPELKGLALGMTTSIVYQILNAVAGNELNNPARTLWTGFFLGALVVIDRETKEAGDSQ